jgi:hypothetical protein
MFDEIPSRDGWYVAKAKLKNDSFVDLLRNGAELDWKKPDFPVMLYPNQRWAKVFREMSYFDEQGYQVFRKPVAKYLCRDWNRQHAAEEHVVEFDLIFCVDVESDTNRSGQEKSRERLVHLDLKEG